MMCCIFSSTHIHTGIGTTYINLLAIVFQVLYGPGALLGVLGMQKYGLRGTLLVGECVCESERDGVMVMVMVISENMT